MGILQPTHLIILLVIVLVVFGAGKLGQIGGALGKSVKDFKTTVNEDDEQAQIAAAKDRKSVID